jgi:hypothetical protein
MAKFDSSLKTSTGLIVVLHFLVIKPAKGLSLITQGLLALATDNNSIRQHVDLRQRHCNPPAPVSNACPELVEVVEPACGDRKGNVGSGIDRVFIRESPLLAAQSIGWLSRSRPADCLTLIES